MENEATDEDRIHQQVVAAVAALDGPSRARLARIERRLLEHGQRRRRSRLRWGLLAAALAAGGAAAYWSAAGDWLFDTPEPENKEAAVVEPGPMTTPESPAEAGESAADAVHPESPVDGGREVVGDESEREAQDAPIIYIAP